MGEPEFHKLTKEGIFCEEISDTSQLADRRQNYDVKTDNEEIGKLITSLYTIGMPGRR